MKCLEREMEIIDKILKIQMKLLLFEAIKIKPNITGCNNKINKGITPKWFKINKNEMKIWINRKAT